MMIFHQLLEYALLCAKQHSLTLVDFGIGDEFVYTKIGVLNQEFIGITITPKGEGEVLIPQYSNLYELLEQSRGFDVSKRALGLSAINAIGQFLLKFDTPKLESNLRQTLIEFLQNNYTKNDKIVFIGNLSPVVMKLQETKANIQVFCRQKNDSQQNIYNDIFEYEALENADIVVITGASLIGSTIDAMLKYTQKARIVILAGFSAGGYYKWYSNLGITHVASINTNGFKICNNTTLEEIFERKCYLVEVGN